MNWTDRILEWMSILAGSVVPGAKEAANLLKGWVKSRSASVEQELSKIPLANASAEEIVRIVESARAKNEQSVHGGTVTIVGGRGGDAIGSQSRAGDGGDVVIGAGSLIRGGDGGSSND